MVISISSQTFIAHQVNNPEEIKDLVDKNIGLEIDIAFSNTKNNWVVAHHDFDDINHPILESWLIQFTKSLCLVDHSKLNIIWLDIKTPSSKLISLAEIILKYIPSNITLIYDLGQPTNILDSKYHIILKSYLRSFDYIASWITKNQLPDIPKLAKELNKDGIINSIISYGDVKDICSQTLQSLINMNNSISPQFKKVFTWNVEFDNEIVLFLKQKGIDGQIIGFKTKPWNKTCHKKLKLFNNLITTV